MAWHLMRYADPCNAPHPDRRYDTMPECPALVTTPPNCHVHYCEFAPIAPVHQTAVMSDHYYPVFQVPESGIDPEDEPERLGSKRKFWFRREDGVRCLFKFPRHDFGEHWAEKVAAEVAGLIGVQCAEVQLARFGDVLGTQSSAFAEPEWLRVHGNEVMVEGIPGYDGSRGYGRGDHSIRNIASAVSRWAERHDLDPQSILGELASYAILDGLIGNTDRHHENWMFFYHPELRSYQLAPSYDHGSSLGRELQDVSRRVSRSRSDILASDRVLNYLLGGGSPRGVYIRSDSPKAPSPLVAARLLCRWHPDVARPWLERLEAATERAFRNVIDRVPDEFISPVARDFAHRTLTVSREELLRSAR